MFDSLTFCTFCKCKYTPSHTHLQVLQRTFPTIWHVDGAEIHNNKECTHWSWQAGFATGSAWDTKMLTCSIPNQYMTSKSVKKNVHRVVARFAKYITHWLALGVHPTHGFYGEKFDEQSDRGKKAGLSFAGGLRFVFGGKKGDAKARMESNLFQRHYQTTFLCIECCAIQPFPNAPKSFSAYVSHTSLLLWYPKMVLIYKKTCCA